MRQTTITAILILLFVLPLVGASSTSAQSVVEPIWQDLQRTFSEQVQAGTNPGVLIYHIGVTTEENDPAYSYKFVGGQRYLIVAACDRNCNDIDLYIKSGGESLVENEEDDDVPKVIFAPRKTGTYDIEVTLWCDAPGERCGYGFGVFALRG